jgi:hypothetical protein
LQPVLRARYLSTPARAVVWATVYSTARLLLKTYETRGYEPAVSVDVAAWLRPLVDEAQNAVAKLAFHAGAGMELAGLLDEFLARTAAPEYGLQWLAQLLTVAQDDRRHQPPALPPGVKRRCGLRDHLWLRWKREGLTASEIRDRWNVEYAQYGGRKIATKTRGLSVVLQGLRRAEEEEKRAGG